MRERINHLNHVERWANFVRENPATWKKIHTEFINALFQKSEEATRRILLQPNGKKKLIELYKIKNVGGFDWLK